MLAACLAFAAAPFLGQGQVLAFAGICLVTGFTLGADFVLPSALQADVIDVDAAMTGQERAGVYLGLWLREQARHGRRGRRCVPAARAGRATIRGRASGRKPA